MTTLPERVQRTIRHLLTLIGHSKTGEDERDTARRMLQRIREAHQLDPDAPTQVGVDTVTGEAPEPGTADHPWLYHPGAWAGSKYHQARTLSLTEIAKLIRADLKLARTVGQAAAGPDAVVVPDPIADAPAQIKYSVRTRYGSLYGAIDVEIRNILPEWGWTVDTDEYGQQMRIATPALVALIDAVETIHRAYNYSNSDPMTDYFERRYWGSVSTDPTVHIQRRR